MNDSDIERELTEAQADVIRARQAGQRRRDAVMTARAAGWSKYRIAAVLGVKGPTVDSIIASAERANTNNGKEARSWPEVGRAPGSAGSAVAQD